MPRQILYDLDRIGQKIRALQAKKIVNENRTHSYSQTVNDILKNI